MTETCCLDCSQKHCRLEGAQCRSGRTAWDCNNGKRKSECQGTCVEFEPIQKKKESKWRAWCDCGWKGKFRRSMNWARRDLRKHTDEMEHYKWGNVEYTEVNKE